MMQLARKLIKEQRGSTVVLVGLSLLLLLTVAGLVIDGGTLYAAKSHLQKTANAAALSGAQELTGKESDVKAIVNDILTHHGEQASLTGTEINMKSTVRVNLSKKVPLGFARLLGKKDVTVSVQAAAQVSPIGAATGVVPMGIDETLELEYYKPYVLKEGPKGGEYGFRGILLFGGRNGAPPYKEDLMHGYKGEVTVGDIVDVKNGTVAGGTRDGVEYRINTDPYPPGEYWHKDSPRLMLVPVYKEYRKNGKQVDYVEIKGFAYFYLLEPQPGDDDKEIRGMFIENFGGGTVKPGAVERGADVIRLIE